MTDYLALYRNYLTTEKRMSANTVSSYMRDLGQYQDWLQQKKQITAGLTAVLILCVQLKKVRL